MGKVFARQIMESEDNSYTITDVPALWMIKTLQAFKDFVADNTITKDQYFQYTGEEYLA